MLCPCQSTNEYSNCCEPYVIGRASAPTAEALMRSRYSAYTLHNIDYIKKTLAPESQRDFDAKSTLKWATESEWQGLKILSAKKGLETDSTGVVEFVATFKNSGKLIDHHEVSQFRKAANGAWMFVDGDAHTHPGGEGHTHALEKRGTIINEQPKIGRNDPCPCGSGKKYKKCCGAT